MNEPIEVKVVGNRLDKKSFIELPWVLYEGDPNWVPPLLLDMRNTLNPGKNALLRLGPTRFYLAFKNGRPVGRLMAGMDYRLNEVKGAALSYFSLFESIDDPQVASALFDVATNWLRGLGATVVTGPQSPSNGDDYRALLIRGFDSKPVLLNSYNPPYYEKLLEGCGFAKQFDRYAYYYDLTEPVPERFTRVVERARSRYGFTIRPLNLKRLDLEMQVIKQVVDEAMPDWPDMIPPSEEEIAAEAAKLKQLALPDLVLFAENREGECLGFAVALPDYNQVLSRLNGRLFPFGLLKFVWYRRKINGARMFALFVTPKGRRRGVSAALYYYTMLNARRLGYIYGEGSTIHEFNRRMNLDAQKAGGYLYKVYRIYQLPL